MNKGLKEVLVRVEYHGQVWTEVISIENINEISNCKSTYNIKDIRRSDQYSLSERNS